MMERGDCIVVGAGVIGLAIAREAALFGRQVFVLEQNEDIGMETSARNSEVIHAGVYYPNDSLKTKLCISGRKKLYKYCHDKNIPHQKIGKLIIAGSLDEENVLRNLKIRAQENAVDLMWLNQAEIEKWEPAIKAVSGLFSPETGIVDSHHFMQALASDIEENGSHILRRTSFLQAKIVDQGFEVMCGNGDKVICQTLVNAAGIQAQKVAMSIVGFKKEEIPPSYFAKGNYFRLKGSSPFSHLVYPLPEKGGLGVHVTLDLAGQCRFGPDVEWVNEVDYRVNEAKKESFQKAIACYYPDIFQRELVPDYAGIRPKLTGPGGGLVDFCIQTEKDHGIRGLVHLFGIESPGLTASLALAQVVRDCL